MRDFHRTAVLSLSMGRTRGLVVMSVLSILTCVGAASAGAAKVYVGDGAKRNYSIAFKTEAGRAYVLGLTARASCEYDDEGEPVPPTFGLSAFPAPRTMRLKSRGFSAAELSSNGGFTEAGVLANFAGDEATGVYQLDYREESLDCEMGNGGYAPFRARRYLPIGRPRSAPPAPGETRVYYDHGGPTQFFARATPELVTGIRGAIATECPVNHHASLDRPLPLFPQVAGAKVDEGRFDHRERTSGLMWRSGAPYTETIEISGQETRKGLIGTYLRVHTTRWAGRARRCVTGPLPIDARRYVPALSAPAG